MLEGYRAQRRLRALIRDWRQLREVVAEARGLEVTMEQEERFRELQARIAARLRSVMDVVPFVAADDARREFGAMTDMLKKQLSLRDAAAQAGDPEAFERFWHAHFIFLNQLKGVPLGRQEETGARRRAAAIPGGTERRRGGPRLRPGRVGGLVRTLVGLAVVALVVYFVGSALGVRYDSAGHQFTVASQIGIAKVVQTALNAVLGVFQDVVRFFDPVIMSYGPIWTFILFIALALTVGYWLFVRG